MPQEVIIILESGLAQCGFFFEGRADEYVKKKYGITLEEIEKDQRKGIITKVDIQRVWVE